MSEQESKLLPCPFCGGEDIRADANLAGDYLQCWACGARGPLSTSECSNWQARAAQPAPVVPEGFKALLDRIVPRLDAGGPNPIDPEIHHCEWTLYQERERIHAEFAAAPAQGQQVECQECGRLRGDFEELAERYGKLQAGEDSLLAKVVTERDQALAELSALKAQQVGQEPAGEVHLRTGGGISLLHVELAQPLPPGTKLYTAPQPAPSQDVAGLVEAAKKADDALSALVRNDQPLETLARKYGSDWSSAIDKVRTELVIQIAAHQQQEGE